MLIHAADLTDGAGLRELLLAPVINLLEPLAHPLHGLPRLPHLRRLTLLHVTEHGHSAAHGGPRQGQQLVMSRVVELAAAVQWETLQLLPGATARDCISSTSAITHTRDSVLASSASSSSAAAEAAEGTPVSGSGRERQVRRVRRGWVVEVLVPQLQQDTQRAALRRAQEAGVCTDASSSCRACMHA